MLKRPLALLLLIALLPAARLAAQPAPTPFIPGAPPPGPHAALLAGHEEGGASVAQSGQLRCTQALLDPSVSAAPATQPWREYRRERLFAQDRFRPGSPPRSLSFVADRDGDPSSGPDVDAAGQAIDLPATLAEIFGALSYYYAPGPGAQGDELRVQLFETNAAGTALGPLIATPLALGGAGLVPGASGGWQEAVWEVADAAAVERLRDLGRAAVVFSFTGAATSGSQIWLDELRASPCVPAAGVGGRVTSGGAPVEQALVALVATDAAGARIVASTRTGRDGAYSFLAAPVQPAGATYRVWFLNRPAAPPRAEGLLGFWAGPVVPQLSPGASVMGLDLEVGDVPLQGPASHAEVVATSASPAALSWGGRAAPRQGERHQLCLYDPARADPATRLPLQVCGPIVDPSDQAQRRFSLAPASFAGAPGFGFTYGRSYRWYVVVYAGDPRGDPDVQYGYSFGERAVTPLGAPPPEAPPPPAPQTGDPAPGAPGADWTLLIYMAADNTIGDARRAPALGRPSGQLASLPALAAAHPRVNLVSYVDRYGPGGAELCAYPPGRAPDCRLRAEANSADPLTLAGFIAYGRGRYPAARTALLIVAPGQAGGALALDETTPGAPAMGLGQIETAFQAAGLGGATRLDLVIYQAPLMGSAEVLRATAPYARYMVASPGQVWQLGPYRQLVPLMAGPSRGDPAAVARGAVTAYTATVAAAGGVRANVWAAYDLGRAGALWGAIETLAENMRAALASEATTTRPALAAARAAAQSYDSSGNGRLDSLAAGAGAVALEEDALVDLRDLAGRLQAAAEAPAYVQQRAAELAALLDSPAATPVIALTARSGQSIGGAPVAYTRARGLGIFFPSGDRLGGQPALTEGYLHERFNTPPGDTLWADMLRAHLAGVLGAGPGGATEGAAGGAQFRPLPGGFVSTTLHLPMLHR